ncbi:beta-ketoacyl synthase N-terminal-like domain-containing protein [soil metagenome]
MSAWIISSSVVSPLGFTSEENYAKVRLKLSGLSTIIDSSLSINPIFAGRIKSLQSSSDDTIFEMMCRKAAEVALQAVELDPEKTLYILSTTKGNIDLLNTGKGIPSRLHLHATAKYLAGVAGFQNYLVVSNACISGVLAMIVAKRFLDSKKYLNCIVVGADALSQFIVSGFESLHALSPEQCKPFDADRKGINLGEAASCVVLSSKQESSLHPSIRIAGGGLSNDANHISGPSRTGKELAMAIKQALGEARIPASEIDFISAHGTATSFNDEMESKAFNHAGMEKIPLHSLKGYFGHTLGSAGVVESVMCVQSLLNDEIVASKGFQNLGVSQTLNINQELIKGPIRLCLKTASGFGGCNAAIVLEKE